MSVVLSSTIMLVDLFVAFMQVKVSAENMWVTIFFAHGRLCRNHAGGIFCSALCTSLFLLQLCR